MTVLYKKYGDYKFILRTGMSLKHFILKILQIIYRRRDSMLGRWRAADGPSKKSGCGTAIHSAYVCLAKRGRLEFPKVRADQKDTKQSQTDALWWPVGNISTSTTRGHGLATLEWSLTHSATFTISSYHNFTGICFLFFLN